MSFSLRTLALPFTILAVLGSFAKALAFDPAEVVARAKAGETVAIPAGIFKVNALRIPSGVSVTGAGVGKTILMATDAASAVVVKDSEDVRLNGLTVRGAINANILVESSKDVAIEQVATESSGAGILIRKSALVRVASILARENRTGVSVIDSTDVSLAGSSLLDNAGMGVVVATSKDIVLFNNLFAGGPCGISVDAASANMVVDFNLYALEKPGTKSGETTRFTLQGWNKLTGFDTHSSHMSVAFTGQDGGIFVPETQTAWEPGRPVTWGFGIEELGGIRAPAQDILGRPRSNSANIGAFEVARTAARKPDGTFEVAGDEVLVSVGLFEPDGTNVAYLFHNRRLRKGTYPFWIPSRDWQGRPIPAGSYELRTVESDLSTEYLGLVGNYGRTSHRLDNSSWPEEMITFTEDDRVIVSQNSFENGMGIRAFDATFTKPLWMLPGGGHTVGAAVVGERFFNLQAQNPTPNTAPKFRLRALTVADGAIVPLVGTEYNRFYEQFSPSLYGMASDGKRVFLSDPGNNKVYFSPVDDLSFRESWDIPAPSAISYSVSMGRLWVISGNREILSLDPESGKILSRFTPPAAPDRLAAANEHLAVLSRENGKIAVYDLATDGTATLAREIGTGDGPQGPIRPDRFLFQSGEEMKRHVAINSKGQVAVVDGSRVAFFDENGGVLKRGIGVWGQHITTGKLAGDSQPRVWDISGKDSFRLDSANSRWEADIRWQLPDLRAGRSPIGTFTKDGKNFAAHVTMLPFADQRGILIGELTENRLKPRTLYFNKGNVLFVAHDHNGDGVIDAKDPAEPIKKPDGSPADPMRAGRHDWILEDGSLLFTDPRIPNAIAFAAPFVGFDANGNPAHDFVNLVCRRAVTKEGTDRFISPYDHKTEETFRNFPLQLAPLPDGGYAFCFRTASSIGTGLGNSHGTDIAGFTKDGVFRWLHPLSPLEGAAGVQSVPQAGLVMSMMTESCDYFVMDPDGLGLGVLSMGPETGWHGMWSDHAQQQTAFLGNDGKPYYLLGDYALNGYHWFRITGADKVRRSRVPVSIDGAAASALAALPASPPVPRDVPRAKQPEVFIKKLPADFPVDGDTSKWFQAGIPSSSLITPEAAAGEIQGATDCSAIVRLGYCGGDLHVQTVVFDDKPFFHQIAANSHQHDGIEMAINGFMQGYKFDSNETADQGVILKRQRFSQGGKKYFTQEEAPHMLKVVNASDLPRDKALMEEATGADLSQSKAIVTEFRIAFAQPEPDGSPTRMAEPKSGDTFWLGFFINDNDLRGSDVQNYIPWPQTYGPYAVQTTGAKAVFE